MDTPGLRSLGLWNAEEGISSLFQDIEELSRPASSGIARIVQSRDVKFEELWNPAIWQKSVGTIS
jgi:acyl-CoA synthetase (NDP forming)